MRRAILLSAVGAIVLGLAAPSVANQSAPRSNQPDNGGATAGDPDRRICVREAITGSRLQRRVCRTAREWVEQEGTLPESR